jgi:hypothetical protein
MSKINNLNAPIYVKGKEYPGNNPYILNEINLMLKAGWVKKRYGDLTQPIETLEPEDLKWEDDRFELCDDHRGYKYLYNENIEKLSIDNCNRYADLSQENNERLAAEEKN